MEHIPPILAPEPVFFDKSTNDDSGLDSADDEDSLTYPAAKRARASNAAEAGLATTLFLSSPVTEKLAQESHRLLVSRIATLHPADTNGSA